MKRILFSWRLWWIVSVASLPLGAHSGLQTDPAAIRKVQGAVAELFSAEAVLVRGQGVEITGTEARLAVTQAYLKEGIYLPDRLTAVNTTPGALERRVIWAMVTQRLLLARATPADIAAAQEERKKQLADTNDPLRDARLAAYREALGLTAEQWENQALVHLLSQTVLRREVAQAVTEEDMRRYYAQHAEQFHVSEQLRVRQIFLKTMDDKTGRAFSAEQKAAALQQLQAALRRIRQGESFAPVARALAGEGGDAIHTYVRGQLPAAFDAVAFSLQPGQVSEIVAVDYGYYLLQAVERVPAYTPAFEQVRAKIGASLAVMSTASFIERLKKDAALQVLDPRLGADQSGATNR
ncbi:MAG: peptidyl-prolyl cis-trans isomerase [Opitutae bacterium]|nr:peptidyl-prolyl cis-trans isomerase [Opitutae bacterium]